MKVRHVYSAPSVEDAKVCVEGVRELGVADTQIALIADSKIQLEQIPDRLKDPSSTDVVPAALRGAVGGGGAGLLAGLVATSIPTAGVTLAGAAVIGLAGAALGTWSSALVGAAVPGEVQRQFEDRLADGEVLISVDAEEDDAQRLASTLVARGASKLDYEAPTALS